MGDLSNGGVHLGRIDTDVAEEETGGVFGCFEFEECCHSEAVLGADGRFAGAICVDEGLGLEGRREGGLEWDDGGNDVRLYESELE